MSQMFLELITMVVLLRWMNDSEMSKYLEEYKNYANSAIKVYDKEQVLFRYVSFSFYSVMIGNATFLTINL